MEKQKPLRTLENHVGKPVVVSNGRFSVSVETIKKSRAKTTNFAVELLPGKPEGATSWFDVNNRPVKYNTQTDAWYHKDSSGQKDRRRISRSAQSQSNKPKVVSKEIRAFQLSEKFIASALLNDNNQLRNRFEQEVNLLYGNEARDSAKSWIDSTYKSINTIRNYLTTTDEKVEETEHVGSKVQSDEFYTADILIKTNKRTLGVSLKKTGNTRMHNTTLNRNQYDIVDQFLKEQDKLYSRFVDEGTKLDRKTRKELLSKHEKTKIGDKSLKEHLIGLRAKMQKALEEDIEAVLEKKNIVGQVKKIFNAIENKTLIIATDDTVVDDIALNALNLDEKRVRIATAPDNAKIIEYGGIPVARLGTRQDGLGYGQTIKLEASFVRPFFKAVKATKTETKQ